MHAKSRSHPKDAPTTGPESIAFEGNETEGLALLNRLLGLIPSDLKYFHLMFEIGIGSSGHDVVICILNGTRSPRWDMQLNDLIVRSEYTPDRSFCSPNNRAPPSTLGYRKEKRACRPCLYYCATHRILLRAGDVELNPGPCCQRRRSSTLNKIPVRITNVIHRAYSGNPSGNVSHSATRGTVFTKHPLHKIEVR